MRLTDLSIRKLTHSGVQKTYFDDAVPGFGIRVGSKTKAYVVMFGKTRRLKTLGHYPHMSLSDARNRARSLLYAKTHSDASVSFNDAREAFLDECEGKNRPSTVRNYRMFLNRLDYNGNVDALTRQKLRDVTDHPHTLTAFKVFLNWCVKNELIAKNPLHADQARYGNSRERVLSNEELIEVCKKAQNGGTFETIVQVLILTGIRRTEASKLHKDWFEEDLLTLPADVTKNGRNCTVPVPSTVPVLLQQFPEQIFVNDKGTTFSGWSKGKARFDKKLENVAPYTLHDLRRTYASVHAKLGTPIHVIEKLLNHVSGSFAGVAGIYNRYSYLDEMREAVQRYEEWLQSEVLRQST